MAAGNQQDQKSKFAVCFMLNCEFKIQMERVSCLEHVFNLVASYRPYNVVHITCEYLRWNRKGVQPCSNGVLFASIFTSIRILLIFEVPKSRAWCIGGETNHRKCNIELNYLQRFRCMPRMEKAHLPRLGKLSRVCHSA